MSSSIQQVRNLKKRYERSGIQLPATSLDIAEWAVINGFYDPPPVDIIAQCADELSKWKPFLEERSNLDLKTMFNRFNKKFWKGSLRRCRVKWMTEGIYDADGVYLAHYPLILIHPSLARSHGLREVLLRLMCSHGIRKVAMEYGAQSKFRPEYREQLYRLRDRGERWVQDWLKQPKPSNISVRVVPWP